MAAAWKGLNVYSVPTTLGSIGIGTDLVPKSGAGQRSQRVSLVNIYSVYVYVVDVFQIDYEPSVNPSSMNLVFWSSRYCCLP